MAWQNSKLLALGALAALASKHVSAFTPFSLSNQRVSYSTLSASDDVSIDYDAAAKLAYNEWRDMNGKGDFDASKFDAFKGNYEALTIANVKAAKKAREEGTDSVQKLELNEFADMTVAQFQAMQGGGDQVEPEIEVDSDVSIVYDSAARVAYDDWRAKFDKGEFVEANFKVFKQNYECVAIANVSTKKICRENESEPNLIELGDDADITIMELKNIAPANPLQTAMEALAAQDAASSAIGEAAAALAEEEEVRILGT